MSTVYAMQGDGNWPYGYLNYYTYHVDQIATPYYRDHPTIQRKMMETLHEQKYHFVKRIVKTHPHCIPELVILMQLKHFVKEQVDKMLVDPNQQQQLEFDF